MKNNAACGFHDLNVDVDGAVERVQRELRRNDEIVCFGHNGRRQATFIRLRIGQTNTDSGCADQNVYHSVVEQTFSLDSNCQS